MRAYVICPCFFVASVNDFVIEAVNRRIAGADPAVSLSRFADYPSGKRWLGFPRCLWEKPFPANEKFCRKVVDFSCASPWRDECGTVRARYPTTVTHSVCCVFANAVRNQCAAAMQKSAVILNFINAGVPLHIVQSIVGHESTAMTRHCYHENLAALKCAVAAIPTL